MLGIVVQCNAYSQLIIAGWQIGPSSPLVHTIIKQGYYGYFWPHDRILYHKRMIERGKFENS